MKLKNHILITLCLGMTISVFGQTKEISKEDYYQKLREAVKKRFETSRRENTKINSFKDGKLSDTVEIFSENIVPDKSHYVSIEKFGDRTVKRESISINKVQYCKKDDGEWKKSNVYCGYGAGNGGPSKIASNKYTVERMKLNKKEVKLYQQYTVYKNIYSPNKDKEGMSYWQQKMWIDKNGFLLREEMESGLIEPKQVYTQNIIDYEYDPKNLIIEVPIKEIL